MDLVIRDSRGDNIVVRPQARARWYPSATAHPAAVEVWMRLVEADGSRPPFQLVGLFPVGHRFQIPYNPDLGKDVELSTISISATGVKSVSHPDDGVRSTVLVRRNDDAPEIGQNGAATAESVTIGVTGFSRFARKRRVRIADNPAMTDATVVIRDNEDYLDHELPRYVIIDRAFVLVPDFAWSGNDPATHGFTKTGTGTTAASGSPGGWRITTSGSDLATYYTKNSWPVNAFVDGFTLELTPPVVNASDGAALPNEAVAALVEDGANKYELTFSTTDVKLNGGAAHAYSTTKVRLVIAPGGATADLWVGDVKVEDNTAGASTATSGLKFGDLATTDDAETVWKDLAYALTPQDPALAQTIYVTVAHASGAAYGPESDVLQVTFASESGGGTGSEGDFDPIPKDRYTYEQSF